MNINEIKSENLLRAAAGYNGEIPAFRGKQRNDINLSTAKLLMYYKHIPHTRRVYVSKWKSQE